MLSGGSMFKGISQFPMYTGPSSSSSAALVAVLAAVLVADTTRIV
jgi:hypothetical protein